MINETIFRSPKWLRDILDFEINTGRDIKGTPSKKEEALRKKEVWNNKFDELLKKQIFIDFLKDFLNTVYLTERDTAHIKTTNSGDDTFFDKFEEFLRINKIRDEIESIYRLMYNDYITSGSIIYKKIEVYRLNNKTALRYFFKNDDTIEFIDLDNRKFSYKGATYTTSSSLWSKFVQILNSAMSSDKGKAHRGSSENSRQKKSSQKTSQKSTDPKRARYDTIMDTIKLRKAQLLKMSKTDSNREALINELESAQRMADKLKREYQFENIKSFNDFIIKS